MKVLFVISSLTGGGAQRVLATLANELVMRNHKVSILYSFKKKDYKLNEKIKSIDSDSPFAPVTGNWIKRFAISFSNKTKNLRFLKRTIIKETPDVVVSFMQTYHWQLLMICKRRRIPLVFSERTTVTRYTSFHNDFGLKHLLKYADKVTILSEYDKQFLNGRLPNVVVMPNPLSCEPISKEEYNQIFAQRRDILAVGRLEAVKGYDELIRSFALVAEKHPSWHLDFAGKEESANHYSETLKALVKELHLEDRVRFLGFHDDVHEVMKAHSIFCLTSLNEGFPNALAEAMAMGMASISFDIVTGPREIISNETDGIIVEKRSCENFAIGLDRLMNDADLRYTLGLHAIENIKRYSLEKMVDKWEQMLLGLVKN
jgi:glycosyltransferase involved in cell wall biosynthesis